MAMDPRKRQQKQQRRKAKERAKQKAERKILAQRDPRDPAVRLERAAGAPILHCCTTSVLWTEGMSNVLISRRLPSGNVAFAVFLVDVYCLGVKDVFFNVASRSQYDWKLYEKMVTEYEPVELKPEAARKLIEGAVAYARDLGLPPHPDYRKAVAIFGGIDASACTDSFSYGKGGRPCFIAGPYDSPERCDRILSILEARCGPNGFHYIMPVENMGALLDTGRTVSFDDDGI
jgi:hypothetical protein